MSLTITKNEDEQRQMAMTIEIEESRVSSEMKQIAKSLAKQIRVPGFRPGKAPFSVVVKRFGEENLRAQAVEDMMNNVIIEALTQEEITPYARPTIENIEIQKPVKLELVVPLTPAVTLGEYRDTRQEVDVPEVSDAAVDEAVEAFIESKIETEPVDRPSALGDMIKLAGNAILEANGDAEGSESGQEESEEGDDEGSSNTLFDNQDGLEFLLDAEQTFPETDFVDQLVGKTVGESVSFNFSYPDSYEITDLAGRQATVNVDVLEIQSRSVPELTEELVTADGYDSIEDFRTKTRERLEEEALNTFKNETLDSWVLDLAKDANLVYSPGVIEQELDDRLENFKKQISSYGWEWDAYLEMQQESEENIRNLWRDDVTRDVENALLMREFFEAEYIRVEEDEIETLIDERMQRFGDMDENIINSMRDVMRSPDSLRRMSTEILSDKAYERVMAILAGEAPDLEEIKAAAEASDVEVEDGEAEAEVEEAPAVEEAVADASADESASETEETEVVEEG